MFEGHEVFTSHIEETRPDWEEDDDSNDEDNWRNDYPDTEWVHWQWWFCFIFNSRSDEFDEYDGDYYGGDRGDYAESRSSGDEGDYLDDYDNDDY